MVRSVRWLHLLDKRFLKPFFSNPPRRLVVLPKPDSQRPHDMIFGAPQSTLELHAPEGLFGLQAGSRTKVLGSFGSLNTTPSIQNAFKDKPEDVYSYDDIQLGTRTGALESGEFGRATPKTIGSLSTLPQSGLRTETSSYLNPSGPLPPTLSHANIALPYGSTGSVPLTSQHSSLTSLVLRASASSLANTNNEGPFASARTSRRPTDAGIVAAMRTGSGLPPLPFSAPK
jgi:hypothetical protein